MARRHGSAIASTVTRRVVWTLLLLLGLSRAARPGEVADQPRVAWTPFQFAIWNPVQLFNERTDVYGLRTTLFHGKNRDVWGLDFTLFSNTARDTYGISLLGLGNELHHGIFPIASESFASWHHGRIDTGNVTGIQISGGAVGFVGIVYPVVFGYYAAVTTQARDVTGAQIALVGERCRRLTGLQAAGLFALAQEEAQGLQVSVIHNRARGTGTSFQFGLANVTEGKYDGLQLGLGGRTTGNYRGAQCGFLLNFADSTTGVQVGLINMASQGVKGVQIGAVNYSKRMTGLQIGAVNIIPEGGLPFFVGINFSQSF